MEKGKEPEKQGIVRDLEYKDGVLYVYSQDLDIKFLEAIESGKYTDLSIEIGRFPTENKFENEEGEVEQEYKWYLTGIAAVKTGSFSRYGLVEYKEYSINNVSYKVINQPNFFQVSNNKSEVTKNMSKKTTQTKSKDEDQIDVIYTPKEDPITTTTQESKSDNESEFNAYVDDLQKSEIKAKEEVIFLEAQIKTLKNKLEDKNNKIDELEKVIPEKNNELLKKDFMIFYLRGLHEEKLQNKFMGFDDGVNQLKIKLDEDIYKSQMWRDYSSSPEMKKAIERQLEMKFFIKDINNTQIGNTPHENTPPITKNYSDNDLYEYAENMAKKEGKIFSSDNMIYYINKAEKEIRQQNL
jgi:hypothetical protein